MVCICGIACLLIRNLGKISESQKVRSRALRSVHCQAPVDRKEVAGGETRILTCQERYRLGDIVGTDQPSIGVAAANWRSFSAVNCSVTLVPSTVAGATRLAVIPC